MPTDDTRDRVADAVLRLIGGSGLDAVSFSTAAQESDVSRGLVQHLFGSREALLRAAAIRLRSRMDETLPNLAAQTPERRLRGLLVALVPASDQAVTEAFAAAGLLVLARRDDELRATWARGRTLIRSAVEAALRECGQTSDVAETASALLGFAGDLRDSVLIGEITIGTARRRIARAVSRISARTP